MTRYLVPVVIFLFNLSFICADLSAQIVPPEEVPVELSVNHFSIPASNLNQTDTSTNQSVFLFEFNAQVNNPFIKVVKNSLGDDALLEVFDAPNGEFADSSLLSQNLDDIDNEVSVGSLTPGQSYGLKISSAHRSAGTFEVQLVGQVNQAGCLPYNNKFNSLENPRVLTGVVSSIPYCFQDCNTNCKKSPKEIPLNYFHFNGKVKWYEIPNPTSELAFVNITVDATAQKPVLVILGERSSSGLLENLFFDIGRDGFVEGEYVSVYDYDNLYFGVSSTGSSATDYDLCVTVYESNGDCVNLFSVGDTIVVKETSLGSPLSGPFQPGETVTFTYKLIDWAPIGDNWIHGLIPEFGSEWMPPAGEQDSSSIIFFELDSIPIWDTIALQNAIELLQWNWYESDTIPFTAFPVGTLQSNAMYFEKSRYGPKGPSAKFQWGKRLDRVRGTFNDPLMEINFKLTVVDTIECTNTVTSYVRITPISDHISGRYAIAGCDNIIPTDLITEIQCCDTLGYLVNNNESFCSGGVTDIALVTSSKSQSNWQWQCPQLENNKTSFNGILNIPLVNTSTEPIQYDFIFTDAAKSSCNENLYSSVIVLPETEAFAGKDKIVCEGEYVVLGEDRYQQNVESLQFQWSSDLPNEPFPTVEIRHNQVFWLKTINAFGCQSEDEVNITYSPPISLDIPETYNLCDYASRELTLIPQVSGGEGAYQYLWSKDEKVISNNNILTVRTPGEYVLKVIDDNLCGATTRVNVSFEPVRDTLILKLCPDLYDNYQNLLRTTGEISNDIIIRGSGGSSTNGSNISETSCFRDTLFMVVEDLAGICDPALIPVEFLTHLLSEVGDEDLLLFPNPTHGILNIGIHNTIGTPVNTTIKIFNQSGVLIKSFTQFIEKAQNVFQVDVGELTTGIYSISITGGELNIISQFSIY